jgi:hypothetical protein
MLRAVVDRHDALRTVFDAGDPDRCTVLDPGEAEVAFEVRGSRPADDELDAFLTEPFPLSGRSRLRALLCPGDEGDLLLALATDHLVMDFVSLGLALRRPAAPAPQYSAFAALQRERLAGGWGVERRAHWYRYFERWGAERPATVLATPSGPGRCRGATARSRIPLDEQFRLALDGLAAGHATTRFVVLTAAVLFAQLLWGATRCGVVTDFHGRVLPGSRTTVGFFSHGTRLHLDRVEGPNLDAAVRRVMDCTGDLRRFALPLGALAGEWQERTGRTGPVGPFVYVGARARNNRLARDLGSSVPVTGVTMQTAANAAADHLNIVLEDSGTDLMLNVRYDDATFRPDTVTEFLTLVRSSIVDEARRAASGA